MGALEGLVAIDAILNPAGNALFTCTGANGSHVALAQVQPIVVA